MPRRVLVVMLRLTRTYLIFVGVCSCELRVRCRSGRC